MVKKGDVFRIVQAGRGWKEYKCHVLEIIDNEYVVYKWYGKYRQYWHYEIEHYTFVESKIKLHKRMKNENRL